MTYYYLGVPVEPELWLPEHHPWVVCKWPDGKLWRHWPTQLHARPWGADRL